MKYLNEMLDKYGFDDGGAVPPDADKSRYAYCLACNCLLRVYGSTYRLLAFDREDAHNGCMIAVVTASTIEGIDESEVCNGEAGTERYQDEELADVAWSTACTEKAFSDATGVAVDLDLDEYVITVVTVAENVLRDALQPRLRRPT